MKKFSLTLALLVGAALPACRRDQLGTTGVQLDLTTTDSRIYAAYFTLSWMDQDKELFQVRGPDGDAFLDAGQAPVVSVFITLDAGKGGRGRVLVRGYNPDGQIIAEGAATLDAVASIWLELPIKMAAFPALPDADG